MIETQDHYHIANHWLLSFGGWIVYIFWKLMVNQPNFDKDNNGYTLEEIKIFFKVKNIAIIFSLMVAVLLVYIAPALWHLLINEILGKDWVFTDLVYAGVGVLVIWLQHKFGNKK